MEQQDQATRAGQPAAPGWESTLGLAALLWDLDNVDVRTSDLTRLARVLRQVCGDGAGLFVAGHSKAIGPRRRLLLAEGYTVLNGGLRSQGADNRLREAALRLRRSGVRHFYLASGDHDFLWLTKRSKVTVITLNPEQVSRGLRGRAQRVLVLVREGDGFSALPLPGSGHDAPAPAVPEAVVQTVGRPRHDDAAVKSQPPRCIGPVLPCPTPAAPS